MSGGDDNHDFYVSPDKGTVVVAKTLDAERQNKYNLTVSVTDGIHVVQVSVSVNSCFVTDVAAK